MTRRRYLLSPVALALPGLASPPPPDDPFLAWNKFTDAMNDYIAGINAGLVKADKLRDAVHLWHKMERKFGWDGL